MSTNIAKCKSRNSTTMAVFGTRGEGKTFRTAQLIQERITAQLIQERTPLLFMGMLKMDPEEEDYAARAKIVYGTVDKWNEIGPKPPKEPVPKIAPQPVELPKPTVEPPKPKKARKPKKQSTPKKRDKWEAVKV